MKILNTLLIAFCLFFTQLTHAAPWVNADVLDNGLNEIKKADKVVAVIAYTAGDSYATVTGASNIVAESAMVAGDYLITPSGSNRVITAASKTDSSANNSGNPTKLVYVDTLTSRVLWAADETSATSVTAGNQVTIPAMSYTANQPN